MRRRDFMTLVAGASVVAWPSAAQAQQAVKMARIGYLASNLANQGPLDAFRQGLRDLGYVEGRNVVIEYRDAQGKLDPLPALAAELVALKVDVIVASSTAAALAARQATTIVPIVFATVPDPVATGLVASLARPGGNVTGLSNLNADLVGKCLEYFTQAVPAARRIAVLWQPGAFGEHTEKEMLKAAEVAARVLGSSFNSSRRVVPPTSTRPFRKSPARVRMRWRCSSAACCSASDSASSTLRPGTGCRSSTHSGSWWMPVA